MEYRNSCWLLENDPPSPLLSWGVHVTFLKVVPRLILALQYYYCVLWRPSSTTYPSASNFTAGWIIHERGASPLFLLRAVFGEFSAGLVWAPREFLRGQPVARGLWREDHKIVANIMA